MGQRFANSQTIAAIAAVSIGLSAPSASAEKSDHAFSFEIPEWAGRVIARNLGKTDKKVIYVLDYHAGGNGMDVVLKWANPVGLAVQRNIFRMLDATVQKNGNVTIVHENWSLKPGESQSKMTRRNLLGNLLSPGMKTDSGEIPLDGGYSRARELAGNSIHQASHLISAAYGNKVTNVAPLTEPQELAGLRRDLRIGIMKALISSPSVTCGDFDSNPENLPLSIATALERPTECGCGVKNAYSRELLEWSKERYKKAAVLEVDAALKAKAPTVVIVAGAGHAYYAKKRLEEKGINYEIVWPEGMVLQDGSLETDPVEKMAKQVKNGNACSFERLPTFDWTVEAQVERTMRKYEAALKEKFGK